MKKRFIIVLVGSFLLLVGNCAFAAWVPDWKKTTPLTFPRAGAAVVVANGFIYIMGGTNDEGALRTTEFAEIKEDGSLGPWRIGPLLNKARGHTGAVIYNGYIYIVGGAQGDHGEILLRSVERARILQDGSLTPWVMENHSLNMPRRCSKVVASDGKIFTLGGFGGDLLRTVEHAEILRDGTVGEWLEEGNTLTEMRYISGVKKAKDVIYIVGGHHPTEGVGITDVEWSKVIDSAGFQRWKKTKPLRIGRYGLTIAAHGDNLYAMGGVISGVKYLSSIEKTTIGSNGELAPWQFTTPLSTPSATFGSVVYNDWIYILGGAISDGYLNNVKYATFNDTGDIGYWGSDEELAAYEEKMKKLEEEVRLSFPNKGTVMNVLQARRYTYIEVKGEDGLYWLAAPKAEVSPGATIYYSKGLSMSKFYSKDLDRSFPSLFLTSKEIKIEY